MEREIGALVAVKITVLVEKTRCRRAWPDTAEARPGIGITRLAENVKQGRAGRA